MTAVIVALCNSSINAPAQVPLAKNTTAAAASAERTVHVDRWLLLGPVPTAIPAFSGEDKEAFGASKLLAYEEMQLSRIRPGEGDVVTYLLGQKAIWRSAAADTSGLVIAAAGKEPSIAYCAAYLEVPRWTKVRITARASEQYMITLDGAEIVKNDKGGSFRDAKSGEAKLEQGKHLLLVKTVRVPADSASQWRIDVSVSPKGKNTAAPAISISPQRNLSLNEIIYLQQITSVALSPDGRLVAITTGAYSKENEKYQSWIEIRNMKDGALARTMRDVEKVSDVQWAPTGKRLSYVVKNNADKGAIRVLDLDAGTCNTIVEDVKNLGGYLWSRDGAFIVYNVTEKAEPDKRGLKHLTNIKDRWPTGGDTSFLYVSTVPGGATRRLTAGKHSSDIRDIHPNGTHVLITRSYEDLSQRPYDTTELIAMNLEDGSVEILWKGPWLRSASYSPDGRNILIQAGPSSFGDLGVKVPAGMIPNDYDGQLYLLDPATKAVEPLTREFDPSVSRAHWSAVDGNIYIVAEDRSSVRLFRYATKKKSFQRIDTQPDVIDDWDVANDKLTGVFIGSGATEPPRLFSMDLAKGTSRMILDPNASDFARIKKGTVEDWSFASASGKTIDGYYYLPPSFDPGKMYPCIVYYYGGTSPTNRIFGGRYPKNLWAAQGYVVYVLQPSGATGYGQEFSAFHVNDWGKIVADEIIEGVKKFADSHPFVKKDRIGCIGASYGGFMTQLLLTKTDIFAAAVSHAGISSIAGYWGEGYWGYSYNAVAAAGSFPWNRRDIYVDQSPLFSADKIKTPLLLIHGTEDTNVPPGESEQMFTALKLLGKNVEYIQVEGQNHAVMDYKKRDLWSKTIMAWFDRYLKNEPEWWNDLYPPAAGEAPEGTGQEGTTEGARAPVQEPTKIGVKVVQKQDGSKVLLGEPTRDDIVANIAGWDDEYFTYQPDETILGELSNRIADIRLVVVLGTWCSDSHREVPRLWKVLEQIGFPPEQMKTLAVERAKAAADSTLSQELIDWSKNVREYYSIKAVESIIVYRNGVELGRIVEAPAKSIEADLLEILKR
jgi:dipeptidyl aminopeptidase/acylaminoacyl peptidase